VLALLFLGLLSFGTLGVTLFIGNIGLIGALLGAAKVIGISPWLVFAAGILPHGIFELTAVFLASASVLKGGAQLVTPQPDKSLGEVLILSLADWFRIFIGVVVPFLVIAALIEVYLTPQLLKLVFPLL
jgi:stage II sporulation protein M